MTASVTEERERVPIKMGSLEMGLNNNSNSTQHHAVISEIKFSFSPYNVAFFSSFEGKEGGKNFLWPKFLSRVMFVVCILPTLLYVRYVE